MSMTASASPDHPRIRGEHARAGRHREASGGSSPHTRGARTFDRQKTERHRIIPAYAGSTCRSRRRRQARWDHPRIRGEHWTPSRDQPLSDGSSPHTRGAPVEVDGADQVGWIIPAYAGSTATCFLRSPNSADHPRIRGEHAACAVPEIEVPGSSPHTRGAHQRAPVWSRHQGIIPAYAGSTLWRRR